MWTRLGTGDTDGVELAVLVDGLRAAEVQRARVLDQGAAMSNGEEGREWQSLDWFQHSLPHDHHGQA